jgi:lysyl endopeptidase
MRQVALRRCSNAVDQGLIPVKLSLKLAVLLAAVLAMLAAGGSFAEASLPPPAGLAQGAAPLASVPLLTPPPVDTAAELASITKQRPPAAPPQFGVSLALSATPAVQGAWETLPDGTALWRVRVRSAGAQALSVGFARYGMPAGGKLLVYDPTYQQVHGPYTAQDNEAHGQLWTAFVPGEELVLEAQLPAGAPRDLLALELGSVVHAVLDPFGTAIEKSGSCNLDVVCPEAEPWRSQVRSVARIVYTLGGRAYLCTGALVNNTAQDGRPLFLTAAHCGITEANAPTVVTYWNFQSPACRVPGSAASAATGVGSLSQTLSGAVFRASYAPSDMTLLELDDPVPASYSPYWAGWDRSPDPPTSAVAVHHPSGDEKRISFEFDPASVTSVNSAFSPGDGTHIRIADWDLGTTEPGSSGSPLFNQHGLVVGQLHSGSAACSGAVNSGSDWYGRLHTSWTGGNAPGTRLSDFLDPLALGLTQLAGTDGPPPPNYTNYNYLPVVKE